MATPAQRTNTWTLDEWYDQTVAGTTGGYNAPLNGELWTWGDNEFGALGQNTDVGGWADAGPLQIPGTTWSDVMGGEGPGAYKSMGALKSDGTLWMWGRGNYGGLGQNSTTSFSSPVQIPGTWKLRQDTDVGTNMKSYNVHDNSLGWAVKNDGTLWAWGYNSYGNLGQNSRTTYSSPVQIPGTTWTFLNKNNDGGFQGIKSDGTMWSMGRGQYGRLGLNNLTNYSSPVQIPGTTWAGVNGAAKHWYAIKTDGTLWANADNDWGQLGLNSVQSPGYSSPVQLGTDTTWSTVSTSGACTVAIKTDGTAWSWGRNEIGSLGLSIPGNDVGISSPTQLPGTTWLNVTSVGENAFNAVKTDGTLWGWGDNSEGQLGQGNQTVYSSPRQIPGTDWSVKLGGYDKGAAVIKTP